MNLDEAVPLLRGQDESESSTDSSGSIRPVAHHAPVAIGVMLAAILFSKLIPAITLHFIEGFICNDCDRLLTFLHGTLSEFSLLIIPLFVAIGIDSTPVRSFISLWPTTHHTQCFCYIVASAFLSLALISPTHCEGQKSGVFAVIESVVNKCLLPAVCEEVVFRGWMFHSLRESSGAVLSGLLTALVFGLVHPWKSIVATVTIVLFSCCWTYANEDTGSLLPSIVAHFAHNFAVSTLPMLEPEVCQTPRFMSFMLWICGTLILFMTGEFLREPTVPRALAT
jgi:membrane protease YdiL (CAAX protease family)